MPRVKRGKSHVKRRKNILAKTKGYKWGRKNLIKRAQEASLHAGARAFADRRKKKSTNRGLWQIRIGAFAQSNGLSYSRFMNLLKQNQIELDRKILADLAINNKAVLTKIFKTVKK